MRFIALTLVAGSLAACAVRSVYVKPDFDRTDRHTLKRIGVYAAPIPNAPEIAARLLARIARRFVLQRKDYLALRDGALPNASAWRAQCKDLHGVLRLTVRALKEDDDELEIDAEAELRRCDSGVVVWRVEIDDTNDKRDEDLEKLAAVYLDEFGAAAEKYAAPLFIVVKTAFDSLPSPKLNDEETMEKIELE